MVGAATPVYDPAQMQYCFVTELPPSALSVSIGEHSHWLPPRISAQLPASPPQGIKQLSSTTLTPGVFMHSYGSVHGASAEHGALYIDASLAPEFPPQHAIEMPKPKMVT